MKILFGLLSFVFAYLFIGFGVSIFARVIARRFPRTFIRMDIEPQQNIDRVVMYAAWPILLIAICWDILTDENIMGFVWKIEDYFVDFLSPPDKDGN